ncbi:hypothetical protein A3K29_01560 [Candidatus Collierbacteria bacterium RIFOXYB2_FULL_46_14]|uniref:Uncharacterized protein n=1 Tax=Candidatus Collierbacteria bacterium GW2011_GWA2_46_26 TaxID=1618381 RepID=A0A0G1RSA8_9BACT|nr:MAG: hypothetical protein UW29_C0006G0052 [Candidatus Collierbacteria bacterium GW2011_GWC2_44_13]KKU32838.1 MAG: hypothetical protein UX47_C0007G0082 [Candidatus Collierbacteria bacterium GW2011_GWA2_46_26]OGD72817.1 MAG: hypothetical protein A3K29_01560 [Candidatus Collierbacteria bacterium RIFOXYB2_FULL_46_14]OGD75859.1 MAG: hypothetical protein A3K43_01560 [Candidatus Collierbacteria bacterium RIFOXYA2_FULL_46_20]OGD77195.1 MAG: hypothetical protein A3K39_01560 [Candidatus Collierbacteri
MFGLPTLSLIALGIAAVIAIGLMASIMAEVAVPYFPYMHPDSLRREIERMKRVQHAQITWGMIAVVFCLLAVILAF